jgi:drug/metabolite transporter (DMT)-like permease
MKKQYFTEGVQYMLISIVCFTVMQGLIKYLPQNRIPTIEQMFFRCIITALFCLFFMVKNHIGFGIKNVRLIGIRSIVGTISMFAFFYILPRMPFGTSVTIKYMSPIFTAMFAGVMLKEKITTQQWVYIAIAFSGVMLLKGFDSRVSLMDLGIGLISAISAGILYIILRKLSDDDHPFTVVFYFMTIASSIAALLMIPYWVTPNMEDSIVFLGVGFFGFIAQIYMTKAFQQKEDANYLAQFKYLEAVCAIILGYFYFGETYNFWSFMGIVLIFLSLILTIRLKNREKVAAAMENV